MKPSKTSTPWRRAWRGRTTNARRRAYFIDEESAARAGPAKGRCGIFRSTGRADRRRRLDSDNTRQLDENATQQGAAELQCWRRTRRRRRRGRPSPVSPERGVSMRTLRGALREADRRRRRRSRSRRRTPKPRGAEADAEATHDERISRAGTGAAPGRATRRLPAASARASIPPKPRKNSNATKWSDSNAAATEEFRVSPVDEGSSSARQKTDRAAAKHAGKATGGGAALQARKERHRSEKRQSSLKRRGRDAPVYSLPRDQPRRRLDCGEANSRRSISDGGAVQSVSQLGRRIDARLSPHRQHTAALRILRACRAGFFARPNPPSPEISGVRIKTFVKFRFGVDRHNRLDRPRARLNQIDRRAGFEARNIFGADQGYRFRL